MLSSSKTYAQTILKHIPHKEAGSLNALIKDLSLFLEVGRQSHLMRLLTGRLIPLAKKEELLKKISSSLDLGKEASALIVTLVKNGQIFLLGQIVRYLTEWRRQKFNLDEGEVTGVTPLDDHERERAINILKKLSGKDILLQEKINPLILGGLILKHGDTLIDASLLRKIKTLKNLLTA
ncbi:MAG: ATP synthase F1 subunit delta [Candidatus Peregrinibacteria bacterium]